MVSVIESPKRAMVMVLPWPPMFCSDAPLTLWSESSGVPTAGVGEGVGMVF